MSRLRCPRSPLLSLALALLLAGCADDGSTGAQGPPGDPGPEGPPGIPGPPGVPGIPADEELPGLLVAIRDVTGASGADGTFQIGDHVAVTFTVETRDGHRLLLRDLDYAEIYASGPTTNYQPILAIETDVRSAAVANADGSWTYTFAAGIPAQFLPPLNDSDAFLFDPGARASEQTGRPLVQGTYTVGMAAYRNYSVDGEIFRDTGNDVRHFLFGGATTLVLRGVVSATACATCHNELRLHGGIRKDPQLCVLCHTAGAEDRASSDPAKATDGATIDFRVMIHRIHRGEELLSVEATAASGDPFRYELVGFMENVTDYSHVAFPMMPGGTGFNQQTRNCEACHGGAAEPDAWFERPSRQACGACHDDVDFDDGTRLDQANPTVADGTLDKDDLLNPAFRETFHVPQADDSSCIGCHADSVAELGVRNVHRPPLSKPDAPGDPGIIGLRLDILSIAGGTGPGGSFVAGDVPLVAFEIRRGDGTLVAAEDTSAIQGVLAGPTGNYQKLLPPGDSTTINLKTGLTGFGPHTVTLTALPATFPAQLHDDKRTTHPAQYPGYAAGDPFTFANGSGERKGQPLEAGTYTFAAWAQRQFVATDGVQYREASVTDTEDFLLGGATEIEPHEVVSDATCNSCHGALRFHGNGRGGVKGCVLCHASGAEDNFRSSAALFEAPEPDTIDFRVMIHKIHSARRLHVVESGGRYDLVGFGGSGGTPEDFSFGELPAMPGGAGNCANCHANDAWKTPVERPDVRIWAKTCGSCHDSPEAKTHIALNTQGTVTTGDPATNALETCNLCHGPTAEAAVETVHKPR